jgi:hypothetical protein
MIDARLRNDGWLRPDGSITVSLYLKGTSNLL